MYLFFAGREYQTVLADKNLLGLVWLLHLLAAVSFLVPILMTFSDLDPIRYLLDYFLPDPKYRSRFQLLSTFLLRYTMLLLVVLDAFRSILFHVFVLTIFLNRITLVFHLISELKPTPTVFYKLYIPLFIAFQGFIQLMELPAKIILSAYFAGIVTLSWICIIMTSDEIGTLLYCWCATLLISAIVVGIALLKTACKIFETGKSTLSGFKNESKLVHNARPCKPTRVDMKNVCCLRAIRMNVSLIGDLGMKFMNSFLYMLVLRTFDAILIVTK